MIMHPRPIDWVRATTAALVTALLVALLSTQVFVRGAVAATSLSSYTIYGSTNLSTIDYGVAYDPSTGSALVANYFTGNIDAYGGQGPYSCGTNNPDGVAVDSNTGAVYVAPVALNITGSTVLVSCAGGVEEQIYLGSSANGVSSVAVDPTTDTVYATDGAGDVYVVNGATNTLSTVINDGETPSGYYSVGSGGNQIAVDPATDTVYVANMNGTVSVIDGATDTVTATIAVDSSSGAPAIGTALGGIAIDPTTDRLYVTIPNYGSVAVINSKTDSVLTGVSVGVDPQGVAVDMATQDVYVVDNTTNLSSPGDTYPNGSLVAFPESSLTLSTVAEFPDAEPNNVAVDPANNTVWVTNTQAAGSPGAEGSSYTEVAEVTALPGTGGSGSAPGPNPPPDIVTAPITGGVLSFVATPSNLTFPALSLDGSNQTTTASLPIDIADATGSGAGWNVTITSTQFSSGAATLPASATSVGTAPSVSCDPSASCTPATLSSAFSYPVTVPAGSTAPAATRLFSAAAGSGMGDQTFNPAFILAVPANAAVGAYVSNWTLSLVSGP